MRLELSHGERFSLHRVANILEEVAASLLEERRPRDVRALELRKDANLLRRLATRAGRSTSAK